MGWKEDSQQRTLDEIEAGKKLVLLYGKLDKVQKETNKLQAAFPRLVIAAVINTPYDHVTIRARPQFIAPLENKGVLSDNYSTKDEDEAEFQDPIDSYPSDYLVAQLALIS